MARPWKTLIASIGIWMAGVSAISGQESAGSGLPLPLPQPDLVATSSGESSLIGNQAVADNIAERLRSSPQLRGYCIDIRFENGVATLTGRVSDRAGHAEAIRAVRSIASVTRIDDQLQIGNGTITPVQAQFTPPSPTPVQPKGTPGAAQDPTPIFPGHVPGPSAAAYGHPPMPPYAWPTYAPYNNYSRVAYPTIYPYQAWPYIGPIYPYPKVPLGWRSISLTWQDGVWWYGQNATGHDWWRLRFW